MLAHCRHTENASLSEMLESLPEGPSDPNCYSRHLHMFFAALRVEVCDAVVDLAHSVHPHIVADTEKPIYTEKLLGTNADYRRAFLGWLDRWQLNPADKTALLALNTLTHMTRLYWVLNPQLFKGLQFYEHPWRPSGDIPGPPEKEPPPEFRWGETQEAFVARAKTYYALESIRVIMEADRRHHPTPKRWKSPHPKRVTEHYKWAAHKLCHPKAGTFAQAAEHFEIEDEMGSDADKTASFERQVRRILKDCGLTGQKWKILSS